LASGVRRLSFGLGSVEALVGGETGVGAAARELFVFERELFPDEFGCAVELHEEIEANAMIRTTNIIFISSYTHAEART
jgi:hypothetical protein